VIDSEDSDEELLNAATLESEDEMIIAYIKGEPVISIFEKKDTLFTEDHDYPKYDYDKNSSGIRWISTWIRSKWYTFGQDAWIRAKTSISQQLTHDKADFNQEKKKSLDDLLPKAYHEYKSVFEKEASGRFPESRPWDHAMTHPTLSQRIVRCILLPWQNKRNSTDSSKKTCEKDIFDLRNLLWRHHFSLSRKRTLMHFAPVKTTGTLMMEP
jgi:hypothetical protein